MSDPRTPLLYVAPWVDLGGSDKGTIDWFRNVDRGRWAPSLITTQPSPNRWLHHVEPCAEELWELPDIMPGSSFPEFILGFIESRGVRVVHIMNARLAFDLLPDMTCLPDPPVVVVQLHAEEPNRAGYVRYVTRRYGNLIDAFSVTSEHLKETVAAYEIPPSKIEVIASGVDAETEFDPARVEPLDLGEEARPRVLWPGRLVEQKDPLLTLDVLARARGMGGDFVLDVVGDGPMREAVRSRAEELGVGDMISWHPPAQSMARWYRSADLMLMTSVYEGVPYVIYESLAMGVPVVAPALPGNREFMDSDSGVLVDPREDADRYAEALVDLLSDDERRREMGERSRRRMLSDFSLAEMGRRHGELYEGLLSTQSATSRWRNEVLLGDPEGPPPAPRPQVELRRDPPPDPTVGVVVPCYRHGIFLDGCIASIKRQTVRPAAIVVVDDGSEDPETVGALARLDDDPEVEVLRQPANAGPSAARNRGLAALETSYFLPLDADDELLPDALETMLAQLREAPSDVGFVYPHAQHIGNRTDYVELPEYNLWLLMRENYCPAPALFDRRVFEGTGIAYPEEIVVGHEDWDLILQMAERGIHGVAASGPTFLYRKQGFSRVSAVDYGPDVFHRLIEERHPALYRNRDELKATWAPALSIVLLDEEGGEWARGDLAGLAAQTCRDFEVLARTSLGDGVAAVETSSEEPTEWLQGALRRARGRWVLLLPRSSAAALGSVSLVEKLLHSFVAGEHVTATVLAPCADSPRPLLAQLDDVERQATEPAALAFERSPADRMPPLRLGLEEAPLADLAVGLQVLGEVTWRAVPAEEPRGPWREGGSGAAARSGTVDLDASREVDGPKRSELESAMAERPRLPELTGTVRRWEEGVPWPPPGTRPLFRHLNLGNGERTVSNGRTPPPGNVTERVLGYTREFAAPGTLRLVHSERSFEATAEQGDLGEGRSGLGFVEDQPLPLLVEVELRRVRETGQATLAAGGEDPLLRESDPVGILGWIDASPILPRADEILHRAPWRASSLLRHACEEGRRHRYAVEETAGEAAGSEVGRLLRHPGPGLLALRLRGDGRLVSELTEPGRASRDPRKVGRWLAEPGSSAGRLRSGAARARYLAARLSERRHAGDEGVVIGHLRREARPASSPLFSATHPVTGDQLVTREPGEALAAGYLLDGVLGFICDPIGFGAG